ncbi:MAG: 2-phospho-L-lactate guanylyltransferase [Gammaproteobacteria bacterium]|nr:2-phospho-L-lactate guanylyltransferase [Gammaproteobacteria bacterium]
MWAIVPYKGAPSGKSRLAEHLNLEQRSELASSMLRDVLQALFDSKFLSGIILATPSSLDDSFDDSRVKVFRDSAKSLAAAIAEASDYAVEQFAAESTFVVPADIPLVTSRDIDFAIENHGQVTIIPDENDIGTNGLLCTPPNAFRYVFDGKSFLPHLHAAKKAGLDPKVVRLSAFGHDVDTIYDLARIADLIPDSYTGKAIRSRGLLAKKTRQC